MPGERRDLNPRVAESQSAALPLGYARQFFLVKYTVLFVLLSIFFSYQFCAITKVNRSLDRPTKKTGSSLPFTEGVGFITFGEDTEGVGFSPLVKKPKVRRRSGVEVSLRVRSIDSGDGLVSFLKGRIEKSGIDF